MNVAMLFLSLCINDWCSAENNNLYHLETVLAWPSMELFTGIQAMDLSVPEAAE